MHDRFGLSATVWILHVRVGHGFVPAIGLRNACGRPCSASRQSDGNDEFAGAANADGREFAATGISRRIAIREKLRDDECVAKGGGRTAIG